MNNRKIKLIYENLLNCVYIINFELEDGPSF